MIRFLLTLSMAFLSFNIAYAKNYNIGCNSLNLIELDNDLSVINKIRSANGLDSNKHVKKMSEALFDVMITTPAVSKENSTSFVITFFSISQFSTKKLEHNLLRGVNKIGYEKSPDDLRMLALFYLMIDKFDDSKKYFEQASILEDANGLGRNLIGHYFIYHLSRAKKQMTTADKIEKIILYEALNHDVSIDVDTLFALGRLFEADGRLNTAKTFYQKIVSLNKENEPKTGSGCLTLNLTRDRLSLLSKN